MSDRRADNTSEDDLDCIRQPLDGESKPLFETAYQAHHASLMQYLRRRVASDADARDIAQEAFLRLMRYRESHHQASLKALLFRIATNLLGMRARAERIHHSADQEPLEAVLEVPTDDPPLEQRLFAEQQLDRLMKAVNRLPAKCQQAFVLSRFHDMGYQEIAVRLGISVKMVEKHIAHALEICREEVGDELP